MLPRFLLKSFTLAETLATLTILVISLYFISPTIFQLQENIKLENEITQFTAFIYQVQTKARYSKKSYSVVLSQDLTNQQWCAIAIKKKGRRSQKCNCLNLRNCNKFNEFFLYKNTVKASQLKTRLFYPKLFLTIDGKTAHLEEKCLKIAVNQQNQILQFKPNGIINVISANKKSNCRSY